jgi:branched-chain amino acid aminotransferase
MQNPPLDDRDGWIWLDQGLVPWRQANIHYLTHGLHYGTTVFEGERAYGGRIFKSVQHSQRLIDSAAMIYLPHGLSLEDIEHAKKEVLRANQLDDAYVRAAIWRGSENLGVGVTQTHGRFAVAAWPWQGYFGVNADIGVRLMTSPWRKPSPLSAPVASKCAGLYALCFMAKHDAKSHNFDDALMLDYEGYVAESTASNIFFLRGSELHTPLPDRFLNGITRQTAIEIAPSLGLKIHERRIAAHEVAEFEAAFLTGTAAEIMPIAQIDNHIFNSASKAITSLVAAYHESVRA